jgi:ribosomal protein S18 acetylase RimI-like enzyme
MLMSSIDYGDMRGAITDDTVHLDVTPLEPTDLEEIAWSGSQTHMENVALQLERVGVGEVEYLAVRAGGHAVSMGGIDFAKESGAGTVYQLATHPQLEGMGLATRLIGELEARALKRAVTRFRLGVELDNARARRLYEHLGYRYMGESEASWEAEAEDGSRFLYTTKLAEMVRVV